MVSLFFDVARVLLCLFVFVYASWSDWKEREVSNKVWLVMAPLAFSLTTIQFVFFSPQWLLLFALCFGVTAGLSIALFYVGAFGGADAKALMCLALALPLYPNVLSQIFPFNSSYLQVIFPITVFSNGVLLAALTVVYSVLRNCVWKLRNRRSLFEGLENESVWRKTIAFLTGYKVNAASLEKGHVYPLEDITPKESGKTERRLLIMPKDEKVEGIVERVLSATREGRLPNMVWVTPGLPLLVFITAGLVIALVFGNLVWILLGFIFT